MVAENRSIIWIGKRGVVDAVSGRVEASHLACIQREPGFEDTVWIMMSVVNDDNAQYPFQLCLAQSSRRHWPWIRLPRSAVGMAIGRHCEALWGTEGSLKKYLPWKIHPFSLLDPSSFPCRCFLGSNFLKTIRLDSTPRIQHEDIRRVYPCTFDVGVQTFTS